MKRRDAFAFANFDSERILQRPYFRQWREKYHVDTDKTDAEILSDLTVTDSDELQDENLNALHELSKKLREYHKIGLRHVTRLTNYCFEAANAIITSNSADVSSLQARYRRANELIGKYPFGTFTSGNVFVRRSDFSQNLERDPVDDLQVKIEAKIKEIDGAIKSRYRHRFAARLQQARRAARMTRERLATLLRITPRTVAAYENAEREPSLATLAQTAKVLNVKLDWLLE